MAMTNTENQTAYRERMYAAGYKQSRIWLPRDPDAKTAKISRGSFLKKLDALTKGWSKSRLSRLYAVFLAAAKVN